MNSENSPKYNRTFHVPWSEGATNDDKRATDTLSLVNVPLVITEKIDGSNTSLEHDGCYARTHSSLPSHPSFDAFKALHASVKYKIPKGIQLFGEWCFAKHSISYSELPGYFLLFNVRDLTTNEPMWASWEEVELWAQEIGVPTVPKLCECYVDSQDNLWKLIEPLMKQPSCCGGLREGIVVRVKDSFTDDKFSSHVLKCVRKNHVTTDTHWIHQNIITNKLK